MNALIFATLLCMKGLVSASGWAGYDDGGYKGNAIVHYGGSYGGASKYGPAPLAHDGRVVDTPEVAHLKAAHAAAHAAAAAAAPAHGWSGYGDHGGWAAAPAPAAWAPAASHGSWAPAASHGGYYGKWAGPPAHIELTHDGKYVKDTPEVAHAKAAHAAAHSAAYHAAAAQPDHYGQGPAYGHGHGW